MDTVLTLSEETLPPPMLGLCVAFLISFLDRNDLEKTFALSPHRCALGQIPDVYSFHRIKHPYALLSMQEHNGQSLISSGPSQACPWYPESHCPRHAVCQLPQAPHNRHLLQTETTSDQGWAQGPPKAAGVSVKAVGRINHTKKGLQTISAIQSLLPVLKQG